MPARNNRGIVMKRDMTRTSVAVEQLGKRDSAETSIPSKKEAVCSVLRGYKKDKEDRLSQPRVQAGSITSIVALRVVGSNENGTQCAGV
jgi:hypothetical protein